MKLDIGCGHFYKGDVNIDLFVKATPHRSSDQTKCDDFDLDTKRIPNFIRADACYLPIVDNAFDEVFSYHTIEHVSNPFLMIKEMVRTAKNKGLIKLVCPHRYSSRRKRVLHKNLFSLTWVLTAFKKCGVRSVYGRYSSWRHFPNNVISVIRLPDEIEISAQK